MKTQWICALWCSLAIVAFSSITVALSGAREPLTATRAAAPSNPVRVAATRAPESAHGNDTAPDLFAYVHMHQTRNASTPLQPAAHTRECVE